jgi:pimeloyl-ACP methyl ester carboxylesterase
VPEIRFFRDSRGRRIAYAVEGAGPPLICPAWWVSHVEEDHQHAPFRRFFEALAAEHQVVRYDRPGVGLSDREAPNSDLAGEVLVLEELVQELGLDQVSLFALSCGGPIALAYAACSRVTLRRLVLFGSYLRGADLADPEIRDAMVGLVRAHWGLGSRALADVFLPGMSQEELNEFTRRQRSATSGETAARLLELTYRFDASDSAESIDAPALVLHRRGDRAIGFEAGRKLAASIPGARFLPLEGRAHPPWEGEDSPLPAIIAFLRGETSVPQGREPASVARCRLDVEGRALVIEGARRELTRLEFGVMQFLTSRPERVVTRDELLREVWGQPFGGSNVVDAVIRSLRKKLGDHASAIETVTGHGYRFVGFIKDRS